MCNLRLLALGIETLFYLMPPGIIEPLRLNVIDCLTVGFLISCSLGSLVIMRWFELRRLDFDYRTAKLNLMMLGL